MFNVTLDPAKTTSQLTLSNGNLTATNNNGAFGMSKGTLSRTSGGYYFETTLTVFNSTGFAVGFGTAALSGITLGTSGGYYTNPNYIYSTDYATASFVAAVQGDVIGVGIERGTRLVRVWKNGTLSTTSPAALVAGDWFPMIAMTTLNNSYTVNFGATALLALPAGYDPWNLEPRPSRSPVSSVANQRPIHRIGL